MVALSWWVILLSVIILLGVGFTALMVSWSLRSVSKLNYKVDLVINSITTTQTEVKHQKRSDPYPFIPKAKVEQRYVKQGKPNLHRQGEVTASGTPVRIGKVAQRVTGGSTGDPHGAGLL